MRIPGLGIACGFQDQALSLKPCAPNGTFRKFRGYLILEVLIIRILLV